MGCGCGGAKAASSVKYVFVAKDGKQTEFATKADALYARDQAGGGDVLTIAK